MLGRVVGVEVAAGPVAPHPETMPRTSTTAHDRFGGEPGATLMMITKLLYWRPFGDDADRRTVDRLTYIPIPCSARWPMSVIASSEVAETTRRIAKTQFGADEPPFGWRSTHRRPDAKER